MESAKPFTHFSSSLNVQILRVDPVALRKQLYGHVHLILLDHSNAMVLRAGSALAVNVLTKVNYPFFMLLGFHGFFLHPLGFHDQRLILIEFCVVDTVVRPFEADYFPVVRKTKVVL